MSQQNLTVALLINNIAETKELSLVFRKAGVVPHFYENLKDFWYGTLEEIPSLALVDVRNMSDGELLLKNHPYVTKEEMPLAFFYSAETQPLIHSTFELFHFGLVRKGASYMGQVKSILRRVNKMNSWQMDQKVSELQNRKLDKQINRVIEQTENLKENEHYENLLKSVIGRFEAQRTKEDFYQAVEVVFSSLKEVRQYSLYELSANGQKLTCPKVFHSKFKELPSLWLGQTCKDGIEFFAQNMGNQVALDLVGGELISIMVKGQNHDPDMMLFARSEDPEFVTKFDWETLERYLGGLHSYFKIRNEGLFEKHENVLQPWELFSTLDQVRFGKISPKSGEIEDEYGLINIDFTELVTHVRANPLLRFFWKNFYNDFFTRFKSQHKFDFQITCMGVKNIGILAKTEIAEDLFNALKSYVLRYPIWRYFEDAEIILSRNLKPDVKMVPLAGEAYLKLLEDNQEAQRETEELADVFTEEMYDTSAKEAFWGIPAPQRDM